MLYALTQNNQIEVGPRDYYVPFFNKFLTDNNITFKLPLTYDGTEPIVITDDIRIVPVQEPTIPPYSSLTQQLAGPFWTVTDTLITGTYSVANRELEAAKNDLKAIVADIRYKKECSGVNCIVQGHTIKIDTSRDARHIWVQSLILLPENTTQRFKFTSDLWLDLTKADIQSIVTQIMQHVQVQFNNEADLVTEIENADLAGLEEIYERVKEKPEMLNEMRLGV